MKSTLAIVGLVFLILGGLSLGYQGFTYTHREQVAQIGSLQVTADKEKNIYLPPALGGVALLVGVLLIIAARKSDNE